MDSLAVTDHGNLHAAWYFYDEARRQGIRPILGFEAYLAFGPRTGSRQARLGAGQLLPPRPAGAEPYRLPQSRQAELDRLHRGVLPPAENRPRGARGPRRGDRLPRGLPERRGRALAPAGAVRSGAGDGGVVRRAVRPGAVLPRDPGPWHRRGGAGQGGDAPPRRGAGARGGGHQRRALPAAGGRRGARRAAGHRHRRRPRRSQAVPIHRHRVVRQERGGDAAALRRVPRHAGADPGGGRSLRVRFREAVTSSRASRGPPSSPPTTTCCST